MISNFDAKKKSIFFSILINIIVLLFFVSFIISSYKLTNLNINIQNEAFQSRFNSRLYLKTISNLNSSLASLNLYLIDKNQANLDEVEDLILSSKSDYLILISELESHHVYSKNDRVKYFDELIIDLDKIHTDKLKNEKLRTNISLKLKKLIIQLYDDESEIWQMEAKLFYELSTYKNDNRYLFIITAAFLILFQIGIILVSYFRHQLLKTINIQNEQLVLQARMSTLGVMSAELAHEINTPLMVIDGRLKQVVSEFNSSYFDKEKSLKNIETILRNSNRIHSIIKNFKLLSKDGKLDATESVKISVLFQELLEITSKRAELYDIILSSENISNSFQVNARKIQLLQVLVNLINNSIDAIKSLDNKWIKINAFEDNKKILLTITDSGSGISQEIQNKLFAPFFTTKSSNEGTGLGLSLSKKIINDHHGELKYNNKSANTQFVITLPKV